MKNIKFIVKVNRSGTRGPSYVLRADATPIHMTTDRKLALLMGKFTAEDAAKSSRLPTASRSWSPFWFLPSIRAEEVLVNTGQVYERFVPRAVSPSRGSANRHPAIRDRNFPGRGVY